MSLKPFKSLKNFKFRCINMEYLFMSLKSFKDFKSFKFPSSNKIAMECRRLVRDWIVIHISNQIYLIISIGFFFFIFGFSISLKLKYKEQFVSYILKCHMPALGPFYQKISWETYSGVLPIQKQFRYLSRIDLYSNSMLIKSNKEWLNIIHQNYSGTSNFNAIPFRLFARKYIKICETTCFPLAGSNTSNNAKNANPLLTKNLKYRRHGSYPIRSIENRIVPKSYGSAKWIQKFYTSLDDIPFKLQSVGTRKILHPSDKLITAFVRTLEKSITKKEMKAMVLKIKEGEDFILHYDSEFSEKENTNFAPLGLAKFFVPLELTDFEYGEFQLKKKFNGEKTYQPKFLHYKNKFRWSFSNEQEAVWKVIFKKKVEAALHDIAENYEEYLQLYSDLDISKLKASKPNQYINRRLQSGYINPDLTREKIKALIIQQSIQNLFTLKSFFPLHGEIYEFFSEQEVSIPPSFCEQALFYFFPTFHSTMPPLKFGYRPMALENLENLNIIDLQLNQPEQNAYRLYRGPAVSRNLISNDAITFNGNPSKNEPRWQFKNSAEWWFWANYGNNNPIAKLKENFFGKKAFLRGEVLTEDQVLAGTRLVDKRKIEKYRNREFIKKSEQEVKFNRPTKADGMTLNSFLTCSSRKLLVDPDSEIIYPLRFDIKENNFFLLNSFHEQENICYLRDNEWYNIWKAQIDQEEIMEEDENGVKIENENKVKIWVPSIILSKVKNKYIKWPLTQLDYQSLNNLMARMVRNQYYYENPISHFLIPHYLPFLQTSFIPNNLQYSVSNGIYQKKFTMFKNFSRKKIFKDDFPFTSILTNSKFSELHEPMTSTSWMLIYKIWFGLCLQKIAKSFYKTYGKETAAYLLDLMATLGLDPSSLEELGLEAAESDLRIINKSERRLRDMAGIDNILPELGEIIWFLRNSGRGKGVPKGILLVGPPGTGKTFLVQAIAGEAQVPVVIQSASALVDSEQKRSALEQLKDVFDQARLLAPCILFIDEIDTLGESRENVMLNTMGSDEIIESMEGTLLQSKKFFNEFLRKPHNTELSETSDDQDQQEFLLDPLGVFKRPSSSIKLIQSYQKKRLLDKQRLSILMQFLMEMDGLKPLRGVVVMGATNRSSVLDPAFIRPGRFEKILDLELPGKQKRIDIVKLYTAKLGIDATISWEYIANRTTGFSAAHLSAAINQSAMEAIIKKTTHTVETIESGIESIARHTSQKPTLTREKFKDPFFVLRLAFYQAGKAVVQSRLSLHKSVAFLTLWPQPLNESFNFEEDFLNQSSFKLTSRSQLETRLIGFYAGKAAELLAFHYHEKKQKNNFFWQSDLGAQELTIASCLANSMIDIWYFYSKQILLDKENQLISNQNDEEIGDLLAFDLAKQIAEENENKLAEKRIIRQNYQKGSFSSWWQLQVKNQYEFLDPAYSEWYRIYLPDADEKESNEEWLPPDEYYNANQSLQNIGNAKLKPSVNWNELFLIDRDYIYHGLLTTCFNKAFTILNNHREVLDYFADHLIRFQIIRQYEITDINSKFNKE